MIIEQETDSRVRLRRTKSVTHAEEIQKAEELIRKSQPDKPCHLPRDSLFSWSSGFQDFSGIINWGFLMLGIGGFRLLLENLIKYGIRVDPRQWFLFLSGKSDGGEEYSSIMLIVYLLLPVTLCFLMEKGMSMNIIAEGPGMVFQIVNLIVMILIPMVVIHVKDYGFSLFGATFVCMLYAILFLKLWSYIQVNMWCRINRGKTSSQSGMRRQSLSYNNLRLTNLTQNGVENNGTNEHEVNDCGTTLVQYPDNLNFGDLYYYLLIPTFCYELNFPRTKRIRKRFLIKCILEVVIGTQVALSVFQQWMVPSVRNSFTSFSNMDYTMAFERLLKLALPNHLMWLCTFYLLFHSFLNLIGELLHFADRNFYNDWWNSNNIDEFWRNWNLPVHRWAVRHLYKPIVEMGYNAHTASVIVFFFSAFFHEYFVSIPLKTFKIWVFLGMMAQIPISFFSKLIEKNFGPSWGNIIVWMNLIIGQPLFILIYYHDYVIDNFGESLLKGY